MVSPALKRSSSVLQWAGLSGTRGAWADRLGVLRVALAVGAGYFVGGKIGLLFGLPDTNIAVLWPPSIVLVVGLLLTPRRIWWAVLGAGLVARLSLHGPLASPLPIVLLYYAANAGGALLTALLLQRFCDGVPRFDSFASTARFIVAAVLVAPAAVAFLLAAIFTHLRWVPDFGMAWQARFLTDALSMLALLPPALLLLTSGLTPLRRHPVRRYVEAAVLLVLSLGVTAILHWTEPSPSGNSLPSLFFAPVALLVWAGIRFGVVGVSVSLLLVAATSVWHASHGLGSFAGQPPADAVLGLQLFLVEVGLPIMLMAALIDERRGIARNLRESNERAHSLAGKLIRAQERERTLIARELHDEIGQALTIVKINLDTMRLTQDPTDRSPLLDEGVAIVEQAIEQVRDLSLLLRPAMLEHLGLEAALRWLVKTQAQRVGYHATFAADELPVAPSPDVQITCYRVLQEALTNIARHSRARNVSVALQVADGQLRLTVRDDGEGFDLATVRQRACEGSSMGLLSLEERASLAHGRLSIVSEPGQGTTLILSLPLNCSIPLSQVHPRPRRVSSEDRGVSCVPEAVGPA